MTIRTKSSWGALIALISGASVSAKAQTSASPYVPGLDFAAGNDKEQPQGWSGTLRLTHILQNGTPALTLRVGAGDRASGSGIAETPFAKLPTGSPKPNRKII